MEKEPECFHDNGQGGCNKPHCQKDCFLRDRKWQEEWQVSGDPSRGAISFFDRDSRLRTR